MLYGVFGVDGIAFILCVVVLLLFYYLMVLPVVLLFLLFNVAYCILYCCLLLLLLFDVQLMIIIVAVLSLCMFYRMQCSRCPNSRCICRLCIWICRPISVHINEHKWTSTILHAYVHTDTYKFRFTYGTNCFVVDELKGQIVFVVFEIRIKYWIHFITLTHTQPTIFVSISIIISYRNISLINPWNG